MRVSIIDLGGTFDATALGFHSLGHEVVYFHRGPQNPFVAEQLRIETHEPCLDADLVICSASFSDEVWALGADQNRDAPVYPDDPARLTVNPEQRHFRDPWLAERLAGLDQYVMVDMSDMVEPYDPFFFDRGTAHFKRELYPDAEASCLNSFPFLYNTALLELEYSGLLHTVLINPSLRANKPEIMFAGTIGHWRYGGKRIAEVEAFRARYPDVPLRIIATGMSVAEVWENEQHARGSLYLAGRGKVCFRLHSAAALGIPLVAPPGTADGLPPAWQHVLPADVDQMRTPVELLEFYRSYYHPMRSAQWILDRLVAPAAVGQTVSSERGPAE